MAGNRRRKVEDFDVSEFLRPSDEDMKSALSSILRSAPEPPPETEVDAADAGGAAPLESHASGREGDTTGPNQPVPFPHPAQPPGGELEETAAPPAVTAAKERLQADDHPKTRVHRRGITPVDRSFDLSLHLRTAKSLFKLNRTELALYEMFLKWTHAVGSTTCQATNRKICETSGIELKTVRRNLSSLRARNLLVQISAYDPRSHEPALYEVNLPTLVLPSI
ncbi:MAG TPA: hypothetical protein VF297_31830 [Pyrinomonadaceae bacterium]